MTKDEALDLALEALEYTTTMSKFLLNNEANIGPILKAEKAITAIKQARALDKKAENARELGLDYEPVQKQRWAVFCSFCNKEWSVSYQHPGKSVCLDCDDAPPAQPMQEPVAFFDWYDNAHWGNEDFKEGCHRSWNAAIKYTTPPAAQRQWVDPNDKTQEQYLPHIGEPVLFCHEGKTYMGKHTGGSFQSAVTNQYFNTWFCHWMYLPAAHGIKEKP